MLVLAEIKDRNNFTSLLKILTILAIKLQGGKIKPLKEAIGDANRAPALEFLKKYGADTKAFAGLYVNILKKSSDVVPFSDPFIKNLRTIINSNRLKHDLDSMSTDSKQVMEPILTLVSNPDSLNALSTLNRRIGLLKEPELTKKFAQVYSERADYLRQEQDKAIDDEGDLEPDEVAVTPAKTIDAVSDQITQLISSITGKKNSTAMTAEQKTKAQSTSEGKAKLAKLATLRKQLSDYKLNEIRTIVGGTPGGLMSTSDLTAALVKRGIKKLNIPPAFQESDTVYVNLDGKYCDSEGRVAVRQGWQGDADILVNPGYSHDTPKKNWLYKVVTQTAEGKKTVNYVQTEAKVAEKRATNFTKVNSTLEQDLKKVKAKWRNNMNLKSSDDKAIYANLAEYIYQTASRVGSGQGETAGSRTYGASNFLVKHVDMKTASETRLKITYPIKSGKVETFVLSALAKDLGGSSEDVRWVKALIKFITAKCKGKSPDSLVFSVDGTTPVDTNKFNAYLKSIDLPFTAKTFRTFRGTELAIEALDQAKQEFKRMQGESTKPLPQKVVNDLFKAATATVGELLGHVRRTKSGDEETTSNTAIKSYINPQVMIDFYQEVGYSLPSNVANAARLAGISV